MGATATGATATGATVTGATATGATGATGATCLDLDTATDQDPNAGERKGKATSTKSATRRGRTVMG